MTSPSQMKYEEIINKNKGILKPILVTKGEILDESEFDPLNEELDFEEILTHQEIHAILNAKLAQLCPPEMTDQIINMTIRKKGKGIDENELIKFQSDLFTKQIKLSQASAIKYK